MILSEARYLAHVHASEDAADSVAVAPFRRTLAAGAEQLIPSELGGRLLGGEKRIRVWREHRGPTMAALAVQAGIARPSLSQTEAGKRGSTVETRRSIAEALSLTIEDPVV